MNTVYETVDPGNIDPGIIKRAGDVIRRGGLVAFPTETVYGLGGDALNPDASRRIYEAKARPSDNPLIVHIADFDSVYEIADGISDEACLLAGRYWPGPLTMIFRKKSIVPYETTGGLDTVAVRFPSHPVAAEFIRAAGGYVAAPSANISGRPSPTSGRHVLEDMDGRIDMIIDSGECDIGLESTIIDFTSDVPVILRPGYINRKMLEDVLDKVATDPAVTDATENVKPKAPGMKYRHYAPKGDMTIVSGDGERVAAYIEDELLHKKENERTGVLALTPSAGRYEAADLVIDMGDADNEDEIAARLYDALRKCDSANIDVIYSEEFDTPKLGSAIMNRLIKAAGHRIIHV